MTMGIEIKTEEKDGVNIVRIKGRLDATSAPVLENNIQPFLSEKRGKLLLDMKYVNYLSSAGMRVMLSATKKLKAQEGRCAFCNLGDPVMEMIKMAGFEKILDIYPAESAALSNLGRAS